jgi:predicted acylesterase/phospholipase RssA
MTSLRFHLIGTCCSLRSIPVGIGLALSGGGFRATLFHLGVIRRLQAEGRLRELDHIASVSGGSILAAHLLAHWDQYTSSPQDFDKAAKELIAVTQFDLRGRILRRLFFLWLLAIFPFLPKRWRVSPTQLLAKYYDKHLFHGKSTADVAGQGRPLLLILSTSVSKAELACFGRDTVVFIPFDDRTPLTPVEANIIPLAQAVAASSAFPGFFPPILLSDADLGAREGTIPQQYFTDGGVYDNLGVYGLRKGTTVPCERLLVSDAGRSFVPPKQSDFGILRTALRAVDIFMFRIRKSDLTWSADNKVTLISISNKVLEVAGASATDVQSQLENIRTDLDKFSQLEITELMRHGYYVTAQALAKDRGDATPPSLPEWDIPASSGAAKTETRTETSTIAKILRRSAQRKSRLFSIRDWMTWVHLLMLAAVIACAILIGGDVVDRTNTLIAAIRASQVIRINPEWTDVPPVPIELVKDLGPTSNDGFDILDDVRVWDLRQLKSRASSSGGLEVIGLSLLKRVSTLIRRSSEANRYRYRYQTAGSDFVAWSPNKDVRVKLLRSEEPTKSGTNIDLNTYELQFDVSNMDLNKKFVLEAQARVNGPWDRNNAWIGMRITDEIAEATMRIIFPQNLPYQRPAFHKYPNDDARQAQTFDGIVLNHGAEKELLWRVDRPQKGWTYRVQWDWQ